MLIKAQLKRQLKASLILWVQSDQIGRFLDLCDNFSNKPAQIFGNFLGYFEKHHIK